MRSAFGIILYVFAGFFVYMVSLMSFIKEPAIEKSMMLLVFTIPGVVFLLAGLGVNRFHNWRRHTGIVLLSGAAMTVFVILTYVSYMMNEEFREMMEPDTFELFSAYTFGGVVTLTTIVVGIVLIMTEKKKSENTAQGED